MSEAILQLEGVTKRFGQTVTADHVNLTVSRGEFFTLLGPSGSGKSTVLRMIAGLEQPDEGRIVIEGKDVVGVPPWERGVGMVFQQYALFPHMTVAKNVGYGLRIRKVSKGEIGEKVARFLQLVGLEGKEERDVTSLSGGEQQRVALARALAMGPRLLLLDEPLGALDEKIRREMQIELKHIHEETGTTFIYVTHDQEEALTMSDRIAVMDRGVLAQCDPPEAIFSRPRTRFVATFFRNTNVLEGELLGRDEDRARVRIGDCVLEPRLNGRALPGDSPVAVAIRAENVRIGPRARECDTSITATLSDVVYRGTNVDHIVELADGQRVVATSTRREVDEAEGSDVVVGFRAEDVVPLEE